MELILREEMERVELLEEVEVEQHLMDLGEVEECLFTKELPMVKMRLLDQG